MKSAITILTGAAVFVGGVAGAGALTPRINQERREQNLTVSDELYDLPADMAIMQAALGVFRGLAINVLWHRAETLKNEGRFHEAIELGELITRLQPRFPEVWRFVSWNQAYNISVATQTPDERWMWVKSGMDLLQRKGGGIDSNPNDLPLYQQLAWIYHHKIGDQQDNMHWHYKRQLADTWHTILGPHPVERDEYLAWFDRIAQAPARVEDLPEGARRLADWLTANGHGHDRETLRRFTIPTRIVPPEEEAPGTPPAGGDAPIATSEAQEQQRQNRARIVAEVPWPDFAAAEDIEQVAAFLRKREITSAGINMEPSAMRAMAEQFGPIDWRHPAAHALYWSRRGLERVGADEGRVFVNEVNTQRLVLNSLQSLAQSGQVVYEPVMQYISYLPIWGFWLEYDDYYHTVIKSDRQLSAEALENLYGPGYQAQMDTAVATAWTFGDKATARALYQRLYEEHKGTGWEQRYEIPIEQFVSAELLQNIDQPQVARGTIVGLLTQSESNRIVYGNQEDSEAQFQKAKELFAEYRQLYPNPNEPYHVAMPPFEMLQIDAITNFVRGIAGPQGVGMQRLPLETRVAYYRGLPEPVKAIIHLQHGNELWAEAQALNLNPWALFPPPPREILEQMQAQLRAGGAPPQVEQPGTQIERR